MSKLSASADAFTPQDITELIACEEISKKVAEYALCPTRMAYRIHFHNFDNFALASHGKTVIVYIPPDLQAPGRLHRRMCAVRNMYGTGDVAVITTSDWVKQRHVEICFRVLHG